MKITKSQLKRIIKEELESVLSEQDPYKACKDKYSNSLEKKIMCFEIQKAKDDGLNLSEDRIKELYVWAENHPIRSHRRINFWRARASAHARRR